MANHDCYPVNGRCHSHDKPLLFCEDTRQLASERHAASAATVEANRKVQALEAENADLREQMRVLLSGTVEEVLRRHLTDLEAGVREAINSLEACGGHCNHTENALARLRALLGESGDVGQE